LYGEIRLACCALHRQMIVYPRETPPHTRTARAQPPAAHRRRHSRPNHRRHGGHSPIARQPHSNDLCSPPKEGPTAQYTNNGRGEDGAWLCDARLRPWALYPFLVGVLSAAAAIKQLPHTILILVSQRFETGGRRCSGRPHTVRRPRLALGDGAATRVGFFDAPEGQSEGACGLCDTCYVTSDGIHDQGA